MEIQKSLLSDAEARLERQAKELARKREIINALPKELPVAPKLVIASGYKAAGTVMFELTARAQALALMEVLAPVPLLLVRGGTVSFIPASKFDGEPKPNQTVSKTVPFVYEISTGIHTARAKVEWWTELGGMLVKIRAELPKDDFVFRKQIPAGQRHDSKKGPHVWEYSGIPAGWVVRWWGSGLDTPPSITIYWDDYTQSAKELLMANHTMSFSVS